MSETSRPKASKAVDILGRKQTRTATVELDAIAFRAEGDQRIPVALSSDTPCDRWFGQEILVHTKDAIDLSYAPDGNLPFLDGHDPERQIGLVEDVQLGKDGKLRGMLRQGNHPDAPWIFADIAAGIRKNISIGYRINELKLDESSDNGPDIYRATRWTPMEGSTVSIPADITVGVGRSDVTLAGEVTAEIEPHFKKLIDALRQSPVTTKHDAPAVESRAPAGQPLTQDEPAPKAKERSMSEDTKNADGAAPEHKPGPAGVTLDEKRKEMADIARMAQEHGMTEHLAAWFDRGLSRAQVAEEILSRKRETARPVVVPGHLDISPREAKDYNINKAIMAMAERRWEAYSGIEREAHDEIAKRANRTSSNILLPLDLQVRASVTGQTAGTASLGGSGVQTTILPLIDLLRNRMLVRQLGATVLSGLTSNVTFPRQATANTLSWTGENPSSAAALTNATLDTVPLTPKTATAASAYSRQLLVQNSFDAAAWVQNDLATVCALGVDAAAINGAGSGNEPTGVLQQSGVNSVAIGANGGFPDWTKLVSFETNIGQNNGDIATMAWLTTPGVRGTAKTTLKSTTAGSAYLWADDNTMVGYRAEVSNQVPSTLTKGTSTTVCHAAILGVWSELLIGEFGGGVLELIVDPLTYARQNMIAVTQVLMIDVAVRHPKCFAVCKDIIP